jgi:structural maintenance of chromosome 1
VAERQQLETSRREQKTLRDALASAEDRVQQAERARDNKSTEVADLEEREKTVRFRVKDLDSGRKLTVQMSDKVKSINRERDEIKAQLEAAQSERSRIR